MRHPCLGLGFRTAHLQEFGFGGVHAHPKPYCKADIDLLKTEGIIYELQPRSGRRAATLFYLGLLNIAEEYNSF